MTLEEEEGGGGKHFSIMGLNYGPHVSHATVTDFYSISVEEASEGVIPMDECIHEFKEALGNVSNNICVEGWVKPHNVAFPTSLGFVGCFLVWRFFLELHAVLESAFLECLLIGSFRFVEFLCAT